MKGKGKTIRQGAGWDRKQKSTSQVLAGDWSNEQDRASHCNMTLKLECLGKFDHGAEEYSEMKSRPGVMRIVKKSNYPTSAST